MVSVDWKVLAENLFVKQSMHAFHSLFGKVTKWPLFPKHFDEWDCMGLNQVKLEWNVFPPQGPNRSHELLDKLLVIWVKVFCTKTCFADIPKLFETTHVQTHGSQFFSIPPKLLFQTLFKRFNEPQETVSLIT